MPNAQVMESQTATKLISIFVDWFKTKEKLVNLCIILVQFMNFYFYGNFTDVY